LNLRDELDALYLAFCATLPGELRTVAGQLPYRLKLAPRPQTPWSQVLAHEVTFAAPAVFAEGMPEAHPKLVRDAFMAHALAVIEAFGTDRIQDRQVPGSPELDALLEHLRQARDLAISRVCDPAGDPELDYAKASADVLRSIEDEKQVMAAGIPVDFDRYEQIALGKTRVGMPASLALAKAAGASDKKREGIRETLQSIWLGMQYQDDVVDWEDDLRRGSSWVILLARKVRLKVPLRDRPTERNPIRQMIFDSRVLEDMLTRGYRRFRAARMRAPALGCRELAQWARSKEVHARSLATQEISSPGYAVRAHALTPWAAEVLV
jgi:hypothetical protein